VRDADAAVSEQRAGRPMNRYTFVIQVHADGPSTLENLTTHELISVPDLTAVGPQIEHWLAALPRSPAAIASRSEAEDPPTAASWRSR
jgi:hypothetical protein